MKKVLLHICCGPCAIYPLKILREQGYEVRGYFYNPNIHPYTEYKKRLDGLEEFATSADLKVIYEENYDPTVYMQSVCFREQERCRICYHLRLERAAQIAQKGKFDFFTTTLLVSKYQNHKLIKTIVDNIAIQYSIPFLYQDFREGFSESGMISREMGLYRQQYCGCLYSEMERYMPSNKSKRI